MSRTVPILQVDAFTDRPFGGNPAGVVLDAAGLAEADLPRIAREMNVSETAFVTPATRADADHRLRWFTPSGDEVRFCGHATVATAHALARAGRVRDGRVVFETLGGVLPVAVEADGLVWLEPAVPRCEPLADVAAFVVALGLGTPGPWASPARTSDGDLLLPAATLAHLHGLTPDMTALASLGRTHGLRGVAVIARETIEPGNRCHSRFFAPQVGIPEDPATGSMHAALAVWLWQAGAVRAVDGVAAFGAEQGDVLGRPGRLRVSLHVGAAGPERVRVGGTAVTVLDGTLRF